VNYRVELAPNGRSATVSSPSGAHWLTLSLLAALNTTGGADETLAVEEPRVDGDTIEVVRRSTLWERAGVTLVCREDELEVRTWVEGRGALADVHLLGGRLLLPGAVPTGLFPTGTSFRTLFSPNPGDPGKLVRGADESAVIGVSGDGALGRGHWFFTPAPLWLGLTTDEREWTGLGIAAPAQDLNFVQLEYRPGDRAFHLVLDYQGHTRVDGEFHAPALLLTPGLPDPYAGLRRHREDLASRGFVLQQHKEQPAWWSEPMFCGWGAQCHLARVQGKRPPDLATQESYDAFLDALERQGIVPGTVAVDDKWQAAYGPNLPDTAKWPDLKGWIADRHDRGQRVLLWWKAWDHEGLPDELCIRTPDGSPVGLDPTNPRAREALRESIAGMLSPGGLDADGLKVDFTARTPSGTNLTAHGPGWGIALLHELLSLVYVAVKEAKPDALVITHTPHPSFTDVTDMLRLNDMLRMLDPGEMPPVVPQMRYRADVVRAACPDVPIDTDDWEVPDKATWREYLEIKNELGVPSLYYATHIDSTGEPLEDDDYEALRTSWAAWRAALTVESGVGSTEPPRSGGAGFAGAGAGTG
jgi:hypothetical protein